MDADIGRGRRVDVGELLDDDGGVQSAQAAAAYFRVHVQTAEAQFTGLGDRLARKDALRIPSRGVRRQFGLCEVTRASRYACCASSCSVVIEWLMAAPCGYFRLIVVLTPWLSVSSSNQRAVTVLVCV